MEGFFLISERLQSFKKITVRSETQKEKKKEERKKEQKNERSTMSHAFLTFSSDKLTR